MSSNTDIIELLSTDADQAVDQIIKDSGRLHTIVNGTGTEQAVTEDGSLIPSVRKALLDNLYFKTPPLPWKNGSSVTEFNQLYSFTDTAGNTTWWYAPGATTAKPVVMKDSPINDGKFKVFLDKTNISDVYAPIVSPDFKGNPRVPLAAPADNTSSAASTAWVQREMKSLSDLIVSSTKGEFENITVKDDAVVKDLFVSGEFVVSGDKLSAPSTEATFRRIRMVGKETTGSAATEIAFEQNGTPPVGVSTKTNIRPYTVATGSLTADEAKLGHVKIGDVAVADDSLDVDGYVRADYLHLEGNNRNSADRPQLIVDGIAEIGTLRVTGTIEGVKADVDGLNIKPNSANITEGLQVGKDTTLAGKLTVAGNTKVNNLEVTGSLSGVAISVDGKDINPRSVRTGNLNATGNVQISGDTVATGKITTQDLEVLGTLTANLDLSGSDLNVDNINVAETATIKDLFVTGTTTGVKADVDGEDINPSSVKTGNIQAGSLDATGNVTVGNNLTVQGEFRPENLATGFGEFDDIAVNGNITQTTGTTRVVNLEVTGTVTGVTADVNAKDIKPRSVVTTGAVNVGADLSVTGKATFGDVEFTGQVTGLDVDLSQDDITVRSIAATNPSSFGNLNTENITNGAKITTQDIQVLGDILDAQGNPVNTFDVTGKDILPNSVQSATSVRSQSLQVEQESRLKGAVEFNDGFTVTQGDILATTGKATLNDVQVNGALTDANGNVIGSVESLEGKDIAPRSVTASTTVQATRLQSTGDILGQSMVIDGNASIGSVQVSGIANIDEARISGDLSGSTAEFNTLKLKRQAGNDDPRLVVQGNGDIEGDLNVSGTITGIVDLSAQDITMNSLQTTEDMSARNMTASATVTGANGVFGQSSQSSGQYGLQSLSSAKVATNLDVGGDLTVAGKINGNIDFSGKDISPRNVTAAAAVGAVNVNVSGTTTTKDLVVTGTTSFAGDSVFEAARVSSKLFSVDVGPDITVGSGTWTPDGLQSVYNVTVTADTVINSLAQLPGAGTYFFYIEQDSAGGHAVTFDPSYLKIGDGSINTAPSSISLVQVIYRGKGTLFDYTILNRG